MQHLMRAAVVALSLLAGHAQALSFDQAYMVAAPFSEQQVSDFAVDGPTPWLFIDLPALGSLFTVTQSSWFVTGIGASQVQSSQTQQVIDRFWLAPSDLAWAAVKTVGGWHSDVSFDLVGIQFAENGGIGVGISEGAGATRVDFSVSPAPVPLPAGVWLLGPALLTVLGLRRKTQGRSRYRS